MPPAFEHGARRSANDARSSRSAGSTSTSAPAARIASAVLLKLPGNGVVSDFFTVLECSRCSPSSIVRAVMATSKPPCANRIAIALPITRLAPVTKALFLCATFASL